MLLNTTEQIFTMVALAAAVLLLAMLIAETALRQPSLERTRAALLAVVFGVVSLRGFVVIVWGLATPFAPFTIALALGIASVLAYTVKIVIDLKVEKLQKQLEDHGL